ncbi:YfiR family protein [Caldimonas brevitalea]|uniref:Transmembrane protein n=1 Tax=Caldimonas brevitalea TaxID=413882 RepID=A0A0G3BKB2_9BURK|nr:YfiR family protein [Caldimonas brevitalea]AKJ26990.1 transmembrane protein [Caldimonas brevitalea]
MTGPRLLLCLYLLLLGPSSGGAVMAQAISEPELKAQIVYRVLLFVQWPSERLTQGQALELCVFEDDVFAQALTRLAGQHVNGRALHARRAGPEQAASCHIAYLGSRSPSAVPPAGRPGLLLVGDRLGLIEQGAMLNLQSDSGRVAFDVGLGAARRAGIEFSAKLLRLARFVKDD